VPSVALPAPNQVYEAFKDAMLQGYQGKLLVQHMAISLLRIGVGFISAAVVGMLLGFAMRLHRYIYHSVDPLIQFLRPIPPLIYIPLLQVWFGIGEMPKDVLIFLCALPFITIGTYVGVNSANDQMIRMSQSLGASRFQIYRYVIFPAALPEIITSLRMGLGMAWTCLVAAEMIAATSGLGWMALMAGQQLQTETIFVSLICIALLGYAMDVSLRTLQQMLTPWKGKV
jgi:NitT/TauT family transport system permease protein/taurine transport system permease protein